MSGINYELAALTLVAFLAAGTVKGVIGMGLPSVAMGVLGLVMLPLQAAALLVMPSLITNVWQAYAGPALGALARRFATMLTGVAIGTPIGLWLFSQLSPAWSTGALGAVLAIYGVIGLTAWHPSFAPAAEPRLSPWIGLSTGLLSGATGVFVIPAVPYLNSLELSKDELIQTLGMSFVVSTASMALGLIWIGRFTPSVATHSLLAVAPALLGMVIGQRIRQRLSPQAFRRGFFVGMLLLGAYMVLRSML